jgi:hypothetical protein
MKRILGILIFALTIAVLVPGAWAQTEERGEVGVYFDYTRLHNFNDANMWGPGGHLGFNLGRFVQLEGNVAFDLERTFTNTSTSTVGTTVSTTTTRSGLQLFQGFFGPKFQTGVGPVKLFGVVKGGVLNFQVNNGNQASTFNNAAGQAFTLRGDTNGVFYPGGGIELFAGRVGVRAEVGDMIYFDNGANHNLKFTVGPVFRF